MKRLLLCASVLITLQGCSSATITKEAAQVAFHSQMTQLLDDCERLGPVRVEYKSKFGLSRNENDKQSTNEMRQIAYDKYGADNVVFINSERVKKFGEQPTIYAQGVAFKCIK